MDSYLDLITQYNKVHRKKNRVIIACIAIAVCLVVAIFGMADVGIKFEIEELKKEYGSYHINVKDINATQAAKIRNRVDVAHSGWIEVARYEKSIEYEGEKLWTCGGDEEATRLLGVSVSEGTYPKNINEVLVDRHALQKYGWSIGDTIKLNIGKGKKKEYIIVGRFNDFSKLKAEDKHGIILSFEGLQAISPDEWTRYFVQFKNHVNISKAITEIKNIIGINENQISKNKYLLTAMGEGGSSMATNMYSVAFVLFILILVAGCLMISNSFSMSVLERVKFFGLMRCLGASKKQIKKYVIREGLQLSLKGIPIGVIIGSILIEISVIILRVLNPSIFGELRVFQISIIGIIAGIFVGFLTVILASLNPAKKASKISPLSAILGNLNVKEKITSKKGIYKTRFPIDISMGVQHAVANKKSFILMVSSFAISIVIFLGFSVLIDFTHNAIKPLKASAPDVSIFDPELVELVPHHKLDAIQKIHGVKNVYGRTIETLSAISNHGKKGNVFVISHEKLQFDWAKDNLLCGKIDINLLNSGENVLVDKESGLSIGDKITFRTDKGDITTKVVGILSDIPFDTEDKIISKAIVSENLFTKLTGKQDYSIVDVQLEKNAPDSITNLFRKNLSDKIKVYDKRQKNKEAQNGFYTMAVFIYGFTTIIAIITLFNIINSMNISVASRKKQYGMMRAVGTSVKQLKRMVLSEALTYSVCGCIVGCILGTILHRILYIKMVVSYFHKPWIIPVSMLVVIILSIVIITILSVITPMKKIGKLDIVNVINAQ